MNEPKKEWVIMWDAVFHKGIATSKDSAEVFGELMVRRAGQDHEIQWADYDVHTRRLMALNPLTRRWCWTLVSIHEVPVVTPGREMVAV